MTKFAVCLYGRYGNRFDPKAGKAGLEYLKQSVIRDLEVDFFVFSYDLEHREDIVSQLGPRLIASEFSNAPPFEDDWVRSGGDLTLFDLEDPSRTLDGTFRFLPQRDGAIRLMLEHVYASGTSYDGVMLCRLDLGQIDKVNQRFPQRVSEAPALKALPLPVTRVYFAAWNQLNEGLPDQWFICSLKHAEKIHGAKDRVSAYLRSGSEYLENFVKAIPDSDRDDPFSNAKNQLNQSAAKSTRSIARALDNHLIHKFDFIQIGLYEDLAPSFDSREIAHLNYSHSSYLDGLNMSLRAQERHLGRFFREYVAIESGFGRHEDLDQHQILVYDDSLSYVERLKSVVERIPEQYIFFTHEDMPLTHTPVTNALFEAIRLLEKSERNAVVRFIRVGKGLKLNLQRPTRLPYFWKVSRWSRWQFSIQPSLWKREKLLELLSSVPAGTVWDLEVTGQKVFKQLKFRGFQPITSGRKRGKHHYESSLYPYVATAIVKGKWNTLEYPELSSLISAQKEAGFPPRELLG